MMMVVVIIVKTVNDIMSVITMLIDSGVDDYNDKVD